MQINPDALTVFGYMLAAGGVAMSVWAYFNNRRIDQLTAEIDAMKEAERLSKAK